VTDVGQDVCMPYDPTIYMGTARYYARGRPPYSRALVSALTAELGLDGSGRLLDVGCGPGTLTIELAASFEEAIGLDPDADMLSEAMQRAADLGIQNVRWVRALAEEIPYLDLGEFRLVTFGQSFQWTDREHVAEAVYELLEPEGAIALIVHTVEGRPAPTGPGHPSIPHEAIRGLIDRYLGVRRRAGQGFATPPSDRYEDALARTRFGRPEVLFAEGRADIVQDIDGAVANYYSTSFCAPHLFGDQLDLFDVEVRAELAARSSSGLFWDWPGDTEILIARKPFRPPRSLNR
jgi:ubiquinone/menaquinone biosynthesis C-methylase UbiE